MKNQRTIMKKDTYKTIKINFIKKFFLMAPSDCSIVAEIFFLLRIFIALHPIENCRRSIVSNIT